MNTELRQITMNMLKETVNFSECILKKCNNQKKEFMASDVHAKYTEIFNKIETHADRKKIINLLIPSDKYLNIAKCKYNKCFDNMNKLLSILVKTMPIFEKTLKMKTPADVVKSLDYLSKKDISDIVVYTKHYINATTYLKMLTIKVKKITK